MFQFLFLRNLQNPKRTNQDIEPEDEDETDPQAGPSSGTPLLPIDDDDAANVPVPNDDKSDTVEYHSIVLKA